MIKRILKNSARVSAATLILLVTACAAVPKQADEAVFPKDVKTVDEYLAKGDDLARAGDLDASLVQFLLALDAGDKSASTYYKIGTIHRVKGDSVLASESFRQALAIDDQHIPSREGLGLMYLKSENYTLADTVLTGVLKDSPDRVESLNALGILHDLREQYELAQSRYIQALELQPKSARLLNNLGYSYYLQGLNDSAEEQFRAALGADPNFDQAWSNLALLYARIGEQDLAQKAFEKVGSEHQALNNLAYINMLLENTSIAKEQLNSSITKSPSYYRKAYENLDAIDSRNKLADTQSTDGLTNLKSGLNTASRAVQQKAKKPVASTSEVSILAENTNAKNETLVITRAASGIATTPKPASETVAIASPVVDSPKPILKPIAPVKTKKKVRKEIYTAQQLKDIQQSLRELGYLNGKIDGVYGNDTRQAIKEFQADQGMAVTGKVTASIMDILL